jgi:hypothetical protein
MTKGTKKKKEHASPAQQAVEGFMRRLRRRE